MRSANSFEPDAPVSLTVRAETFPLSEPFVISRGAKSVAKVVVVSARRGTHEGRGECVPYARYGESVESVRDAIAALGPLGDRHKLQSMLPPGAARNAVDCALWDLEAKEQGRAAAELAGTVPRPVITCFTLSLGSPDTMAAKASHVRDLPLLKLKLGGAGDIDRMAAVRAARPDARLVADANEAWTPDILVPYFAAAARYGFELIEQPLPAGSDQALAHTPRPVPVCADESVHARDGLEALRDRYDAVNIKLDKTGGLTEAMATADAAGALGFSLMVGSMVGTSLGVAPALLLAARAQWADLDGPMLLAADREHGIVVERGLIMPASARLWG